MRKYGKFEKRTEKRAAKEPQTPEKKSLLLQTYFTSLMSLVLCVTMFFGTTYAWFTSEVTNTGNEIYIGTLDVELEKKIVVTEGETAREEWVSLSEMSNDSNNVTQLFNGNIRWEPGYTALETIKITNEGDLAFNYVLQFTDGTFNDASEMALSYSNVAEHFVVYVHAGAYADGEVKPTNFGEIKNSENWKPVMMGDEVATLADIMENELPVITRMPYSSQASRISRAGGLCAQR